MRRIQTLASILATISIAGLLMASEPPAPKLDKTKLETYLRYAEGFTSGVKLTIDDPSPSPYTGYFRLLVHLSAGSHQADRVYYISSDGERLVNGAIWNINETPFLDILQHLTLNGPSFGPETSRVTMVIFSDFECPYCRDLAKTIRENVPQKYPRDVRVVFKNFPIDAIHKWARAAAEAGHCLADQKAGAFWAFHDWIFDHQQEVTDAYEHQKDTFGAYLREKSLEVTKAQGMDSTKFSSCLEARAAAQPVEQDAREGRALQIQQTPTLFVNGRMIPGAVPWGQLDTIIQMELNRPADIPGPSASSKCCEVNIPTAVKK